MPDAGVLATILLVAGLFLMALELMVPSFGLLGISATVCLVISLWSAGQAWWGSQPGFFWTYLAVWVGGIPAVLLGTLYLIQNTVLGMVLVNGERHHAECIGPMMEAGTIIKVVESRATRLVVRKYVPPNEAVKMDTDSPSDEQPTTVETTIDSDQLDFDIPDN